MKTIKNIVSDQDVYKKHNSFHDFISKTDDRDMVMENIKLLNHSMGFVADKYENKIVKRALNDLLNKTDMDSSDDVFKLHGNVIQDLRNIEFKDYSRYLFYRYRYEIFPTTKELDDFPPCLQIEPTSICNFRCVFCYQTDESFTAKEQGHMGNMGLEMFKKIIDESVGKVEAVTLASRGEPMANKDIGKMLQYMSGKFLATKMNTNASLFNERRCREILDSDLHTLVFSADAADENLYSQLRVGGKLSVVLNNVKMFNEIKEQHYPHSKMITRVSGVKVNDLQNLEDMEKLWGNFVDQIAFVAYNPWENSYTRPINEITTPCTDLWRRAFVWFDGRFNPCDVDYKSYLSTGNIKDKSISEMWNSDTYNSMREKHLNNMRCKLDPCKRCTVI